MSKRTGSRSRCIMGCTEENHSFSFPSDQGGREIWIQRLGLYRAAKSSRLCEKHFSPLMFTSPKQNRLNGGAIPYIHKCTSAQDDVPWVIQEVEEDDIKIIDDIEFEPGEVGKEELELLKKNIFISKVVWKGH